jgi:hypothetical protein
MVAAIVGHNSTATVVLAAVSSVAAAAAAAASWRSVWHSRQLQRDTRKPHLVAMQVWNPTGPRVEFDIRNVGQGHAIAATVLVVVPGAAGVQDLATAMPPNAGLRYSVINGPRHPPDPSETGLVLYCRDVFNKPHAWSLDGREIQLRRLKGDRELGFAEVWARLYPHRPGWSDNAPLRFRDAEGVMAEVGPLTF